MQGQTAKVVAATAESDERKVHVGYTVLWCMHMTGVLGVRERIGACLHIIRD